MKQLSSHLKNSLMAVLLSMGASSLANAATQEVVFKKLCHFTKLFTIEGMTPCKTLTLMKP